MKISNKILLLCTRIILLSSFVTYFFCICHSGSFPIVLWIQHNPESTKSLIVTKYSVTAFVFSLTPKLFSGSL